MGAERSSADKLLTPGDIAKRLRISPVRVKGWIRRGELPAINLADSTLQKITQYRVAEEDLIAFLNARRVSGNPPRIARPRRKDPDVIKFY